MFHFGVEFALAFLLKKEKPIKGTTKTGKV
jgi:hypothetical protein